MYSRDLETLQRMAKSPSALAKVPSSPVRGETLRSGDMKKVTIYRPGKVSLIFAGRYEAVLGQDWLKVVDYEGRLVCAIHKDHVSYVEVQAAEERDKAP